MGSESPFRFDDPHDRAYYLGKAERFERWADHFEDHSALSDQFRRLAAGARKRAESLS